MRIQKITSDNFFKFLRELAIIFVSIVLAFLFEDYRENRNQITEYKETLVSFQKELSDVIGQKSNLDSFRVVNDKFSGREFGKLINIIWLDSLVTVRQARLIDLQFIIENDILSADLFGGYGPSPLSQEIRIKYGEQILNKRLLDKLRSYDEEMTNLQRLQQLMGESHKLLHMLLEKTNPFYKFNRQDSLVFYSNEFIWRFKQIVDLRRQEYLYKKWLYQKVFLRVLYE